MPRIVLAAVVLVALLAPPSAAFGQEGPIESPEEFVFEGAGWGHGVGLSQYGARGQSISDPSKTGERIAEYYYPGATVRHVDALDLPTDVLQTVDEPLWVNLDTGREVLAFTPIGGPVELCLSGDDSGPCPKPEVPQAGERWTFETLESGGCAFFIGDEQQGTAGDCQAAVAWPEADRILVEGVCGSGNASDCEYREGELKIRPSGSAFHVSLAIGIEDYLRGLGELPIDWKEPGVNEAQVIASRSYALHELLDHERRYTRTSVNAAVPTDCYCHMYDDTRDQAYVGTRIDGLDRENLASTWTGAVDATTGEVLTYLGAGSGSYTESGVIKAFYFSSSGGWTESNVVGFGSSSPYPFFVPVEDPWALDPATGNPNASWSEPIAASTLANLLGVDAVTSARLTSRLPEAIVEFEVVVDGTSRVETRGGAWFRTSLGLRSPSVLTIDGVPAPPFDDIVGSTHHAAILAIRDAGITLGCDPDSYCPQDGVTRSQMASFIVRAMELPPPSGDHFGDDDGSTHEDSINRLFEAGITAGCAEGRFCPDLLITRGQMAAFLYRALNLTESGDDAFSDDDGSHFEAEINALAAAGITAGCGDGVFCPDDSVSRGQMASFLARAFLAD